jgi:hypothetical protein
MPPKPRPPKKGSKADLEAKAAKEAKKASSKDNLASLVDDDGDAEGTVFDMGRLKEAVSDEGRVASGTLVSEPRARDIKIDSFSLALHGANLVENTVLELNHGSRYGLIGRNGCGKSTFLKCLAAREVPIPDQFDIYLLDHEAPVTEMSALEYVIDSAEKEVARLEQLVEDVLVEYGPDSELLQDLYERLEDLDPTTFETRASLILSKCLPSLPRPTRPYTAPPTMSVFPRHSCHGSFFVVCVPFAPYLLSPFMLTCVRSLTCISTKTYVHAHTLLTTITTHWRSLALQLVWASSLQAHLWPTAAPPSTRRPKT